MAGYAAGLSMAFWRAVLRTKFWEPEEAVGSLWDRFVDRLDAAPTYPEAGVDLDVLRGALGTLFRGLGGARGVEIKAGSGEVSQHRRSWRRRLARSQERMDCARFDGSTLYLPERIEEFPDAELNRQLYLWLAALAVVSEPEEAGAEDADPLRRDIRRLRRAHAESEAAILRFPGLGAIRTALYAATLAARPSFDGPPIEAEIEAWIRARLAGHPLRRTTPLERALAGGDEGEEAALAALAAPPSYRSWRPVLLWGERAPAPPGGSRSAADETPEPGAGAEQGAEKTLKAQRRKSDQADRRDSLILHRFEALLSFGDFLNLNRDVDDDDEESARKAAEDAERIDLAPHHKKPRTRLKFDLDLAPEDGERERCAGRFTYPEWDWKKAMLIPEQARVLETIAEESPAGLKLDAPARRRIEAVRRRFEALRPRRRLLSRQVEGGEIDLDECVRALTDRRANGHASDRLYRDARNEERDLAVAVLFDSSRSTESAVSGRPVIAIAREALVALAHGLQACGDAVGIFAFSSLRRDRVFVDICKDFAEPFGARVDARIAGLKPGFYTRLGAAIRHASFRLGEQPNGRKLLLVITDGKPNDLDHYEGRFGVEDTRRAVMEARRRGQAVFCIAIDAQARSYLPHLFGPAGFAVVPQPEKLTSALPAIYRNITG